MSKSQKLNKGGKQVEHICDSPEGCGAWGQTVLKKKDNRRYVKRLTFQNSLSKTKCDKPYIPGKKIKDLFFLLGLRL